MAGKVSSYLQEIIRKRPKLSSGLDPASVRGYITCNPDSSSEVPVVVIDGQVALQNFIHSAKSRKEDLSDLLIAHAVVEHGCDSVLTFDKRASAL